MLNRGTLLLLVSAIALGGGVLLFENRGSVSDSSASDSAATGDAQGEPLLPFEENAIAQLSLDRSDDDSLSFFKDESGIWQMSAPEAQVAEEGAIAFLLNQLTRPSNRVISVDSGSLADFGLDNPEATITLEAEDSTYQLLIGSADFGGDQRYVQVKNLTAEQSDITSDDAEDSPEVDSTDLDESTSDSTEKTPSEIEIHLVSGGITDAIARPTAEWLVASQAESPEASEEPTE